MQIMINDSCHQVFTIFFLYKKACPYKFPILWMLLKDILKKKSICIFCIESGWLCTPYLWGVKQA